MRILCILAVLIKFLTTVLTKRAGVTQCTTETYPGSYSTGGSADSADRAYMIEHKDYQFQCCGVVSSLNYNANGGSVTLQIWRQKDDTDFELISSQLVNTASGSDIPEIERVSFREGDYLGWYNDGSGITYGGGTVYANRYTATGSVSGLTVNPLAYETFAWSGEDAEVDRVYDIQAVTAPSEPPYFKNVPSTLMVPQSDVLVSGVLITTIQVTDRNLDDASGLQVRMNPDWTDIFTFDTNSLTLTTVSKLRKELSPYLPVFRVEEDHCGLSTTATLTVSVVNSGPKITNLPAFADVHEDTVDETLLYTVTLSDPENEAVWCKGDWTIGQEGAATPFIVKMISTTPGSSSAGIYLIEWPKLDFGSRSQYQLSVKCQDIADNTVFGTFTVNIIENQKPIFLNLDNSVEVDATKVRTGTTIFTVSTTDPDGDQVTFTSSCNPLGCPVALFDSGHVMLTAELLFHNGDSVYTLEVTPSDHRASNTARTLTIFIINISNAPVLISPNSSTAAVQIDENTATSTSIFQASATDADAGDTLEFSMTISPSVGWQLFTIDSTSGVVSTHSSNIINFESLGGTTSFSISIMVKDGKQWAKDTLTIDVIDVNEPPRFVQPAFAASANEDVAGTPLVTAVNLQNMVIDPDDTTWTFTLDCGSFNAYFSMDPTTGIVTLAQDYDLDATSMPTSHLCAVTAADSVGNNATATYYLSLTYQNDNSPVFNPSSYSVTVGADTVSGTNVLQVTATDADAGTHGNIEYELDQSSLGGTAYFIIDSKGNIYVDASLETFSAGGSYTITVTARDTGGQTDTANVAMVFTATAATTTTTTDANDNRDIKFIEDARNVAWLSPAVITMVIALGVIIYMVVSCVQDRHGPISDMLTLNFKLPTLIRPRIIREKDENAPSLPFGKQRPPVIRHYHAKDFRVVPIVSQNPNPVSKSDPKPDTITNKISKKAETSVNQVNGINDTIKISEKEKDERMSVKTDLKDDEAWMDMNPSQGSRSVAPTTIVTHPKSTDRDYLNPKTPKSNGSAMFSPKTVSPSPSVSLSQGGPDPIRVTPSPLSWNNTGEDDDISLPGSLHEADANQE